MKKFKEKLKQKYLEFKSKDKIIILIKIILILISIYFIYKISNFIRIEFCKELSDNLSDNFVELKNWIQKPILYKYFFSFYILYPKLKLEIKFKNNKIKFKPFKRWVEIFIILFCIISFCIWKWICYQIFKMIKRKIDNFSEFFNLKIEKLYIKKKKEYLNIIWKKLREDNLTNMNRINLLKKVKKKEKFNRIIFILYLYCIEINGKYI